MHEHNALEGSAMSNSNLSPNLQQYKLRIHPPVVVATNGTAIQRTWHHVAASGWFSCYRTCHPVTGLSQYLENLLSVGFLRTACSPRVVQAICSARGYTRPSHNTNGEGYNELVGLNSSAGMGAQTYRNNPAGM